MGHVSVMGLLLTADINVLSRDRGHGVSSKPLLTVSPVQNSPAACS